MGKISVVILTHERLGELKECLDGIFSQSYKNYEIVIIDDSVNNETEMYIKSLNNPSINYEHRISNEGIGEKRRLAYLKTTGDYITFIDDDDYFTRASFFSELVDVFKKNADVDYIVSDSRVLHENENSCKTHSLNLPRIIKASDYLRSFQFKYDKPASTLGLVVRKEITEKANFSNLHVMNDTAIYLWALVAARKVYHISKPIGNYRMHNNNMSKNVKAELILDQLKEKKRIYSAAKSMLRKPKKLWLYRQVLITTKYFAHGGDGDEDGVRAVMKYLRKEIGLPVYFYMKLVYWKKNHAHR